jgi:hypothetical protein
MVQVRNRFIYVSSYTGIQLSAYISNRPDLKVTGAKRD